MIDMGNFGGLFGGLMQQQTPQQFGTPLQGMGLGSPFFANRPRQVGAPQPFTPTRSNSMSPQAMGLLGMGNPFPNLVGPTSALPEDQQVLGSQLRMYGMEDQLANQQPDVPVEGEQQLDPETIFQTLVNARAMVPTPAGYGGGNDYRIIGPDGRDYWSNEQWQQHMWDSNQGGG